MKKTKINLLDVKRNCIPKMGVSPEEREENLALLEQVKKNQTKPGIFLPKGFNYSLVKKKTS